MKRLPVLFLICVLCVSARAGSINQKSIDALNTKAQQSLSHNVDSAKQYARQALTLALRVKYKAGEAKARSYLGVVYDIKGKADSALVFFQEAIRIQTSIHDLEGLSYSYNNAGILFYAQYNYVKALWYYRKSLETDRVLKNKAGQAGTLVNMGIIYSYIDSMALAEKVYTEAMALYEAEKDSVGISHVWANVGKLYMMEKDYTGALMQFLKVQRFLQYREQEEARCSNFISLANVYSKLNQHARALDMCAQALAAAQRLGSVERRQFVYDTYTDVYAAKGDYAHAYSYLKLYTGLRDSILNEDRNAAIAEMSERFETEKKDAHIRVLVAEREKERLERKQNALLAEKNAARMQIVFVLLVAVLLVAGLIYWGYSNKQKLVRTLGEKNRVISEHLKQKEMLVGEVHHRVKNNLQLISSILDLHAKSISDENISGAIIESRNRVYSMSVLHQLLYQQNDITGIAVKPYFEKIVMGLLQTTGSSRSIALDQQVQILTLDIDTGIPLGLILNELVTNALKYAFEGVEKPVLSVLLRKEDEVLIMVVSDNGKGTAAKKTEPDSFGFKLIRSLCRQLKAEWETSTGNGYTHTFRIKNFKCL